MQGVQSRAMRKSGRRKGHRFLRICVVVVFSGRLEKSAICSLSPFIFLSQSVHCSVCVKL